MTTVWMLGAGLLLVPDRPSPARARLAGHTAARAGDGQAAAPRKGDRRIVRLGRRPAMTVVASAAAGAAVLAGAALAVALSAALIAAVVVDEFSAVAGRRRDAAGHRSVATALEVLAAELAAGSRESSALRAAADAGGPSARCLGTAARLGEIGADPATGFEGTFSGLAGAWRMRATCGTPLAQLVASVGDDVAARTERRRALDCALAGPRASGAMLASLPVLGVVLGAAMGAHPLSFLFGAGRGSTILLVGVGLEVGGWCWIKLLVARALR